MSTYPKAPGSPHISPTTGAIAEELGWTPQSSPGVAQLHAKHTNAYSLLPPLDTKQARPLELEAEFRTQLKSTDFPAPRHGTDQAEEPLLVPGRHIPCPSDSWAADEHNDQHDISVI